MPRPHRDQPADGLVHPLAHDIYAHLGVELAALEREELRILLLNTKNVVLRVVTVYSGNVSASLVRVGELFREAVRDNVTSVILVHNHPSGNPTGHVKSVVFAGATSRQMG
jgi:DNA repair protein RadC